MGQHRIPRRRVGTWIVMATRRHVGTWIAIATRRHVGTWIVITVLLAAALVGTLWVPFYNHLTPALGGFPFFYWYQMLWVLIEAVLLLVCYRIVRADRRRRAALGNTGGGATGTTRTDRGARS